MMTQIAVAGKTSIDCPYNGGVEIDRIGELLAPFLGAGPQLWDPQLRHISMYIDMLLQWNCRTNLTAVRSPEEIIQRHFGESLYAARHLFPDSEAAVGLSAVDIGSGAGFPGLPLKIWAPPLRLTLIEANHKKATFLREVCRALKLTDVTVLSARAEKITASLFDVVTLRAVERFDEILPISGRFVRSGGRMGLLIGMKQVERVSTTLPNFDFPSADPIPQSDSRILLVGTKAGGNVEDQKNAS